VRFVNIFFILFLAGVLPAQVSVLDSLRKALPLATSDTTKALLHAEIAWELKVDAPKEAAAHLEEAIRISKSARFPKGEATALNYYGVMASIHGELPEAIAYYDQAIEIRKALDDLAGVASIHNNVGNLLVRMGDNLQALTRFQESLKIVESLGDTLRIARANYSISQAHVALSNYPEALNHLYEYLAYAESSQDQSALATSLNAIGNVKAEIELTEEALDYFHRARVIREKLDDPMSLANTQISLGVSEINLGERWEEKNQPDSALAHFNEGEIWLRKALDFFTAQQVASGQAGVLLNLGILKKNAGSVHQKQNRQRQANQLWEEAIDLIGQAGTIRESLGEQSGLVEVYNALGDVYRRQKKYDKALAYTQQYMALAEETNQSKFIRTGYKDLSRIYAQTGDWEQAYEARKQYDELRWEEFNEKRIQDYARREVMYGDFKKQVKLEKQEQEIALQEAQLREARTRQQALFGGGVALLLLAFLLWNRYRIKSRANRDLAAKNEIIDAERQKSDALLLNILPEKTALELKQYGRAQARHYESVTVLFSDFVGFTEIAAKLSAEDLVAELDTCFRAFDHIIAQNGLEKIKTIGDAYLCVGGLPEAMDGHAPAVIRAAIAMQQWINQRADTLSAEGKPHFRMRIGISSGPVVAGVVGDRKFAYDIWGDTVNTAARMESAAEVGRINISAATRQLLNGQFKYQSRGVMAVKGKGEMEMFWVESN
jgi:class 3 adenylate cyclase/tetratricopeptide (TPR) repeat protein